MAKKTLFVATTVFLTLALVLFGCLEETTAPTPSPTVVITPTPTPAPKSALEQRIEQELAAAEQIKTRTDYFGYETTRTVFANLEKKWPFPEDFYKVRTLVTYGKLYKLETLDEKYWKQPEFYPLFEDIGVKMMADPPAGRWGAFGFGSYPADTQLRVARGGNFSVATFFHTSWLVETYQGMQMVPVYNAVSEVPNLDMNGSNILRQDVERARKYITLEFEPQSFVLEPAFPIFLENWARRIKVFGQVSADAEPGFYVVGVGAGPPSTQDEERWLRAYLTQYTSAGGIGVGRPYYQILVEIV